MVSVDQKTCVHIFCCPKLRYAGAEGEVYAHVCKKYGEPMLEVGP